MARYHRVMTVVRNLPEQLILAHAPWAFGGLLIVFILAFSAAGLALLFNGEWSGLAALFMGAGLPGAIFALSVQRDQAIFDALSGRITLQRQTLWRYQKLDFALSDMDRAELQEIAETARPVVFIKDECHALVEAYVSGNRPRDTVQLINDWHWQARRMRRQEDKDAY